MNRKLERLVLVLALCVSTAWAATRIRDYVITHSTIDSTPIGQSSAAAVNTNALTVNGAAPSGHLLCGDGTKYADSSTCGTGLTAAVTFPSRSFNVTYTNGSGHVLFVSGSGNTSGGGVGNVGCAVNGSTVFAQQATATQSGGDAGFALMVPAAATYECAASGAVTGVRYWAETVLQ